MDFAESKAGAAREIALAFGVPPLLLGLPGDNTFSNYTEANRAFWRQTVLPLVARVQKCFQSWLVLISERAQSARREWRDTCTAHRKYERTPCPTF